MEYDELLDLLRREKGMQQLAEVSSTLYAEMEELLEKKKREASEDILALREYENAKEVVKRIKQLRISKVLFFAAQDIEVKNATPEEEALYLRVKEAIAEAFSSQPANESFPQPSPETAHEEKEGESEKGLEEVEEKDEEEQLPSKETGEVSPQPKEEDDGKEMVVKIIKYVEAYRSVDGNVYGPFNVGEVVKLPREEGEWLIASGYAVKP